MMKKSYPFSDDIWDLTSTGFRIGATSVAAEDTLMVDDGEPLPTALNVNGVITVATSAANPVASIATLADYLVNGFWRDTGQIAHH